MLVYSVASKQSFDMIRILRDKILNHLVPTHAISALWSIGRGMLTTCQGADWVPLIIVGNKSDLKNEQRQVVAEEGKRLAEEFKCAFTEASARLNENVSKAFELMIMEVEKSQNPSEPTGGSKCSVM